jgi:peptidoglycan/xylan/chitin deacetylase (PgdA/CDA1 family)
MDEEGSVTLSRLCTRVFRWRTFRTLAFPGELDKMGSREAKLSKEGLERLQILVYHRIANSGPVGLKEYRLPVEAFEAQMSYLRQQGYHSVDLFEWSLGKLTGRPGSGRPILITFDDGYRDFIDLAWPVLHRQGLSAMVFVVTHKVGSVSDWDLSFGNPAPLLSWTQIRQLRREGVRFGSHTATHQRLSDIPIEDAIKEASWSRTLLQEQLGEEVHAIAYPWGVSDARIRKELIRYGYKFGLTTNFGIASSNDDLMALPRIEVFGSDSLSVFAQKLGTVTAA